MSGTMIASQVARLAQRGARRLPKGSLLPTAGDDFERRDPDYIREVLPLAWMIASFWFRGEVRGLEKIPAAGPVLLVGNHSGGNMTPDTGVFVLGFSAYFGVERPFYLVRSLGALKRQVEAGASAPSRLAAPRRRHRRAAAAPRLSLRRARRA